MRSNSISLSSRFSSPRRGAVARLTGILSLWRQRRALARLDNAALDDIGLTRRQAEAEARRPLWDAPEFWQD